MSRIIAAIVNVMLAFASGHPSTLFSTYSRQNIMKNLGAILLCAGIALAIFALNMDVGVSLPAQDYGYGVRTPAMEVANIDRMEQRQNFLIFGGVLAVIGAVLFGFGTIQTSANQSSSASPNTPEPAKVDNPETPRVHQETGPLSVSICPSCRFMGRGDDVDCGRCGAKLGS